MVKKVSTICLILSISSTLASDKVKELSLGILEQVEQTHNQWYKASSKADIKLAKLSTKHALKQIEGYAQLLRAQDLPNNKTRRKLSKLREKHLHRLIKRINKIDAKLALKAPVHAEYTATMLKFSKEIKQELELLYLYTEPEHQLAE